jgi:ABC-type Zn uptake system ZnuABC Zn-binding protein ZnuA
VLRSIPLLLPLLAPLAVGGGAHAAPARSGRLRVVATIRDLEDIAREIGGERVETKAIADGRENIHFVAVRPSDLIAVERADVFVEIGLSLEHAWVPGLVLSARNERIEPGRPGFVNVSDGWEHLLQVPVTLSRQQGADIHPQGNPHINLDPRAGRHFARQVLEHLCAVDPAGRGSYEERHAAYLERLDAAEARWKPYHEALQGQKVVLYHADFNYFCAANGIEVVGTLEPKPGLAPTPGHLADLIALMREQDVRLILTAAWSNNRNARKVAEQTGARILEAPVMVGGVEGAETWIAMMDWLHEHVAAVLGVEPAAIPR